MDSQHNVVVKDENARRGEAWLAQHASPEFDTSTPMLTTTSTATRTLLPEGSASSHVPLEYTRGNKQKLDTVHSPSPSSV